jgi:hypothetical protein
MNVTFDGEEYKLDLDEIDLSEARYIKRQTGLTLMKLQEGLKEVDGDSLAALYWLMLKQSGKVADLGKLNFAIVKFAAALSDAAERESEKEAEKENPTPAEEVAPATT